MGNFPHPFLSDVNVLSLIFFSLNASSVHYPINQKIRMSRREKGDHEVIVLNIVTYILPDYVGRHTEL